MSDLKLFYARARDCTREDYNLDLMVRATSPEEVMTALLDFYEIPASYVEDGEIEVCVVPDGGPGPVSWDAMYESSVMVTAYGSAQYEDPDNE